MRDEILNSEFRVLNFYTFTFDATACSGCKACQVACKDKNQLPLGVLWRRVYEVSGGEWKREGGAWSQTVFAYNLSLACNHCQHPKCAGVCPTDAYTVREDGIVLLDPSRCMGCGYCAWACPYGAPQYNSVTGTMTKCDFCHDNLDAGLAPACVAACPLRVLDYAECKPPPPDGGRRAPRTPSSLEVRQDYLRVSGDSSSASAVKASKHVIPVDAVALWEISAEAHPYPLPTSSHTQPHLAIKPHAAMKSPNEKMTANLEEVRIAGATGRSEAPLVGFTLLVQMAVGAFWALLWLLPEARPQLLPMLLVGVCLGAGLAMSFAHLGKKRNAWRALSHLGKSWLSRELLFTLLFGATWLGMLASIIWHVNVPALGALTALLGLVLLHCMSQVYGLAAVPAWNSWRTEAQFYLSAALLGILGMIAVLLSMQTVGIPWAEAGSAALLLLLAQAAIERSQPLSSGSRSLQFELILTSMIACAAVFFIPGWLSMYSSVALLLIVLAEQALARWSFYQARQ